MIVSNCSPLRYFAAIGCADIFGRVFGEVAVPPAVRMELAHSSAPEAVRVWIAHPPRWLKVTAPVGAIDPDLTERLDAGESEAIQLALNLRADFIILDERKGRQDAQRLGLRTMGALGVLLEAYRISVITTPSSLLNDLRAQGFRVSKRLIDEFERQIALIASRP